MHSELSLLSVLYGGVGEKMNKSKIANLLEELINELKRNDELFFTDIDNERIVYVENVIKELRENE